MRADFPYVYPYSAAEAERRNEIELWRESFRENIACKEAIEQTIRNGFDGMHLSEDCAQTVIGQFGFKRTACL